MTPVYTASSHAPVSVRPIKIQSECYRVWTQRHRVWTQLVTRFSNSVKSAMSVYRSLA